MLTTCWHDRQARHAQPVLWQALQESRESLKEVRHVPWLVSGLGTAARQEMRRGSAGHRRTRRGSTPKLDCCWLRISAGSQRANTLPLSIEAVVWYASRHFRVWISILQQLVLDGRGGRRGDVGAWGALAHVARLPNGDMQGCR